MLVVECRWKCEGLVDDVIVVGFIIKILYVICVNIVCKEINNEVGWGVVGGVRKWEDVEEW